MTLSQNFGFLFCRECVGWFGSMCMGSLVFFDLSQPSPALVRSYRNAHHLTGLGQTGSSSTSLTYQQYSVTAILGAAHDSASPQIARTFFDNVSKAAVSANASFLRRSSRSSS